MQALVRNNYWLNITFEQEKKFIRGLRIALVVYCISLIIVKFAPLAEVVTKIKTDPTAVQFELTAAPSTPLPIATPQPTIKSFATPQPRIEELTNEQPVSKNTKVVEEKVSVTDVSSESKLTEEPSAIASTTATRASTRAKVANLGLLSMKNKLNALQTRTSNAPNTMRTFTASSTPLEANLIPQSINESATAVTQAQFNNQTINDNINHQSKSIELAEQSPRSSTAQAKPIKSVAAKSSGGRSEESVRITFEKNKTAFFTLYNRALRQDPSLKGKVVFKVTIESNGNVSNCIIASSDLTDKELEKKLIAKIKAINFGFLNSEKSTITYAIDFFPG